MRYCPNIEFDVSAPADGTAARKIYDSLATGGVLSTTITANIQTVDTGVPTLDELIETGLASCELRVAVESEDNLENYSAVIPAPMFKAMNEQNKVGFAREAMANVANEYGTNFGGNNGESASQDITIYNDINLEGEQVASSVNRFNTRQMKYADGRGW